MNWFKIDFERLLLLLLPTFLRKAVMVAFLKATMSPLDLLHKETLYKMQHNGQVIYLEKVLNELLNVAGYDSTNHESSKQIKIIDAPVPTTKYVYREDAISLYGKPYLYVGNVYVTGDFDHNDFVVQIPAGISFVEAKVKAIINYYKLVGKKYTIEII